MKITNKVLRRYFLIFKQKEFKFLYFFFFTKFLIKYYLYEKYLVKSHEKLFLKSIKNKTFQEYWFSWNAYYWLKHLNKINGNALEIGSFEGMSAYFIMNNLNLDHLDCVDPWTGNEEFINENLKNEFAEINFDQNLNEHKEKYTKHKIHSDKFFSKNKKKFNLIFIDGSHEYSHVFNDLSNSFNVCNVGGYIILDDIFFNWYKKIEKNPIFAISEFIGKNKNFKFVELNYRQLIIKKI